MKNSLKRKSEIISAQIKFLLQQGSSEKEKLESGSFVIPHPDKVTTGGEDAHFFTENYVAIADGVSSVKELNVDPSIYPKKLIEGACQSLKKNISPLDLMWAAYKYAQSTVGASTFCILSLQGKELKVANLGDSGFLIIRNKSVYYKTKGQQHAFNCPYQLGTGSTTDPSNSEVFSVLVQNNDIIVAASDGLFDNLFEEDILELVDPSKTPSEIAETLAQKAKKYSVSILRLSPFAKNSRAHGKNYIGGKLDDITVIVSKVILPD